MIDKIKSHFEDVKQAFHTLFENAKIPFELNEEMSDMEQHIRTIFRNKNKGPGPEPEPEPENESEPEKQTKYDFAEGFVNIKDEDVKKLGELQQEVVEKKAILAAVQAEVKQIETELEGHKLSLQGIELEIQSRKEKKEKEGFTPENDGFGQQNKAIAQDYEMQAADIAELSDADLYNQRISIKEKIKETELLEVVPTLTDAEQYVDNAKEEYRTLMEKMGIGQGKLKDTYLLECEPSINIDKNNRPNDPFTILHFIAVIVLNIPSVFIKFLSRDLFKLLTGKIWVENKPQTEADAFDIETIRKTFVEMGYIFLTFWLTYNVLFFALNPRVLKSKGPWTKFKWIPITIFKKIAIVLYYPTEFFLRLITKNINPSFEYVGVEKYKPINFMWVFFVTMFFIYNYLGKFRLSFFESFITRDQFPKCAGMVTFLLVMRYLMMYFGPSFTNALSWYISIPTYGLTRIVPFIFVVIMVHAWAGVAQFTLSMFIFYYLLGPFFIKETGFTTTPREISELYSFYSGAGERSCSNTGASFMEKLNMLLGTYILHEIKPTSKIKWSTFYYCIMILFFIYRMLQIEYISSDKLRIFTGLFGGIGIAICVICIALIHFFKVQQKRGLQIGENDQFKIKVPDFMKGLDQVEKTPSS